MQNTAWFSGTCRCTWCGHCPVMLTFVSNTPILWHCRDSYHVVFVNNFAKVMDKNLFFDQCSSASLCWLHRKFWKREVRGFLSEAASFLYRGRQRSPSATAPSFLDKVAGSSTKLRRDGSSFPVLWLFFLLSGFYFLSFSSFYLWKSEGFDRAGQSHFQREAGGALSPKGVNVGALSSCTGFLIFLWRTFRCLSSK